ncbi:MAG: polysaccharide biosynthesis protein [Oscillospiraceae bacterium]|nr:polysaccharide biosynthesis protein [Oscillospiraceae bacterium]
MISAIISKILGAVFKIPLTNILGGVGMSYFSCAYSIFLPVYALSVTGLSASVSRLTAQSSAFGMYDNAKQVKRIALIMFSLAGIAGSLLIYITAKPFSIYIGDCPEAELAIKLIAPSVFFGCITAVERGYYEGLSNMYPTGFSQLTESIVKMASGLFLCIYVLNNSEKVLAYFPPNTDIRSISAAAGILGVTLSSVGALIFFPLMKIFIKSEKVKSDKTLMSGCDISRELLLTAIPIGISAVVTNLTSLVDLGTITAIIGKNPEKYRTVPGLLSDEIPHFLYGSFAGIALTVFNLIPSVTNMLGKGILPSITEAWESKNLKALEKNTLQALLVSLFISAPSAVGIGVLAEKILMFLYSGQPDEVSASIRPLQYLMPAMVFLCLSFPIFSMLQAIGKPSVPLKIMIIGTLIKLAGNLILIPIMSINGASLSTTISYAFILIVSLAIYLKATKIKLYVSSFIPILYATLFCGVSAWIANTQLSQYLSNNNIVMFASTFIGGIVYIGVLAFIKKLK